MGAGVDGKCIVPSLGSTSSEERAEGRQRQHSHYDATFQLLPQISRGVVEPAKVAEARKSNNGCDSHADAEAEGGC